MNLVCRESFLCEKIYVILVSSPKIYVDSYQGALVLPKLTFFILSESLVRKHGEVVL
jgi:hypothetical protein